MKKLMIAAAIVCAVGFANAATFSWTSTGKVVNGAGVVQTTLPGGSIVAIILTDSTAAGSDWANGTWTAAKGSVTELGTATIKTSGGTKGKATGTLDFAFGDSMPIANDDVLAVVFKDATTGAYNQFVYQADGKAVVDTMKVSGLDDNTFNKTLAFATAGNFMAQSVPEPTSAMLLILGVAGLALRRRRA